MSSLIWAHVEEGVNLRYYYEGPYDDKNRQFCANLIEYDGAYVREEVQNMDNGQGLDVFVNCGGYGCRHRWSIFSAERIL